MFDPDDWWCCITSAERGLVFVTLTAFFTPEQYIIQTTFDGYWVAFTGKILYTEYFTYWLRTFGLTSRVVEISPTEFVAVYDLNPDVWSLLYLQSISDNAACGIPCPYISFPFNLP